MKKVNLSDVSVVQQRVLSGIKKMAELVSLTLGPAGKSVLIERGMGEPLIVDDGRRVAENIKLDDPVEQLAVRVCYGVTRKTDEKVGDGTSTSMVLAYSILDDLLRNHVASGIGVQTNVAEVDIKIQQAKNEIIVELDKMARRVKTEKELVDVATVVVGDAKLGEIIGKMYWQMGKDGHISMEFNLLSEEIETEVVSGYRFSGGYAAPWMITDLTRKDCVMDDVEVLVTRQKITDFNEIAPIANMVGNAGRRKLVIIAPKFSESALKIMYQNAMRKQQPFVIIGVRAPGRGEEAMKDMAIFTGGKYFSESDDLKMALRSDLGYCDRVEITDDTTILIGGKGKPEEIKKRIKEVEAEAKLQKLPQFKQDRYERVSALAGQIGLIKIGAPTDEERNWLKYKIEDAKYATKQAFKYGIIKGGGTAFKEISEKLPESNILKQAILLPYETLKASLGGKMTVGKNVIDPVSVEKVALENACSAVAKLLRIGGAICYKPTPELDEAMKSVVGQTNQGDDLIEDDNDA